VTYSFGTGQTGIFSGSVNDPLGRNTASYKAAASSAGTETMTRTYSPNDNNDDLAVIAVKQLSTSTSTPTATSTPYRQSFTYDWLGNLLSVTNGATSTGGGATPTILDTLPLAIYQTSVGSSDSRSYTVPAGSTNKLFLVLLTNGNSTTPTATLNGASLTSCASTAPPIAPTTSSATLRTRRAVPSQ
jgi:hypothetical protein